MERWEWIPGWEGIYQVSTLGSVRSVDREVICASGKTRKAKGKVLRQIEGTRGYLQVNLSFNGRREKVSVHRVVKIAFDGLPPEGEVVCHNDGNQKNNSLENLRFDTQSNNNYDSVRHGSHHNANKTHCPRGHELRDGNLMPSKLKHGCRSCLKCDRERHRKQKSG